MGRSMLLVLKNSFTGLASQIISMFFLFITRNLFIKYIGIDLLGLNGTFASILQTLSLAELGFQTAIVHSMYKPLAENDTNKLNDIVNAFKYIYRIIGIIFIVGSLAVCPFLDRIITGIEVTKTIYLYFLIQSLSSVASYFLAYKRRLLFADQKDYISKIIDMAVNIVACLCQLIAIVFYHSYFWYITIKVLQVVIANIFVHISCNRIYPYLKKDKLDKNLLGNLWTDVKSIFIGKIASYIYSSTDNLVISSLISTSLVGVLTNYTVIILNLKTLLNCLVAPIAPIVGKSIAERKSQQQQYKELRIYTHFRFILASLIIIPVIVLIDTFICFWVGEQYTLGGLVVVLICIEFYIHLVHSALCDYVNGEGLFNEEKNISIIAAIMNLITSIVLALGIGLEGVLIGTIISQSIFWVGRSMIVSRNCFYEINNVLVKYWGEQILYAILFVIMSCVCKIAFSFVTINHPLFEFLIGGILCEVIIIVMYLVAFHRNDNFKELLSMLKKFIGKEA